MIKLHNGEKYKVNDNWHVDQVAKNWHLMMAAEKMSTQNKTSNFETDHEFHVSGSGRLHSGSRCLFTQIRCWNYLLRETNSVVFEEDDFQSSSNDRITVHDLSNPVEQFDDQLGHSVSWSSLCDS